MVNNTEGQESVLQLLKNLKGLEPLKKLFWSELNYERINTPLSRDGLERHGSRSVSRRSDLVCRRRSERRFPCNI